MQRIIIMGPAACCEQVQRQLALLEAPPQVLGLILTNSADLDGDLVLGTADELERIIGAHEPDAVIVTAPATQRIPRSWFDMPPKRGPAPVSGMF